MWNDFKKGFWYSVGAIFGVWAIQTIGDKITEIQVKKEIKDENENDSE